MAEPFLGEIRIWSGTRCPVGWAYCSGQLLSIDANNALFALLGTTYGGDGITTFALPNLSDRVPVHTGQGPGLSNISLGQAAGTSETTLTTSQMPAHIHTVAETSSSPDSGDPANRLPAAPGRRAPVYSSVGSTVLMNGAALSQSGGSQPVPTQPPCLVVSYIIALEGIFPSRN